jgi:tetratricopeptide (TPR) repeat protein
MEVSDPGVHDAWVNLGTLYFMGERTRDAIAAYEKALVSNPSSTKALLSLGKCHFNLGETDEAIARFQQVVDVAPESIEASEAKAFIVEFEKSQDVP